MSSVRADAGRGDRRSIAKPLLAALALCACAATGPTTFETPDAAIAALAEALEQRDVERAEQLFGENGLELLRSGDEVADQEDSRLVRQAIAERVAFEPGPEGAQVAVLGHDAWPFPIPLVLRGGRWRFDIGSGIEELENRRIGRNELSTLSTLHAYVDAQREYRASGYSGDPPAYAARVISSAGQRDGLSWPTAEGEPESPFGPLVAAAAREGYEAGDSEHAAYHGYVYRTLAAQGAHAPGGARSYADEQGHLTGGFALLAWPAKYGMSGVMTFVVNQQGIVFEQDLGPDTETLAAAITSFDPDPDWAPTAD